MGKTDEQLPITVTMDDNTRKCIVVIASLIIWLSGIYMILKIVRK